MPTPNPRPSETGDPQADLNRDGSTTPTPAAPDQAIDIAGTEADEPPIGEALENPRRDAPGGPRHKGSPAPR